MRARTNDECLRDKYIKGIIGGPAMLITDDLAVQYVSGAIEGNDQLVLKQTTTGAEISWPILNGKPGWKDMLDQIDRWSEFLSDSGVNVYCLSRVRNVIRLTRAEFSRFCVAVGYFYGQAMSAGA